MPAQTEDERYLAELEEYLSDYYADRDALIRARRKARDGDDFTVEDIPEAYRTTAQVVIVKRNADTLLRMQSIITDDDAAWTVPPINEEDSAKRNSSLRERWLEAAVERMVEESGRDAIRMAMDSALADSIGVLKLTYLPDAWKDEPGRHEEIEQDGKLVKREKDARAYLEEVEDYHKRAPFPFWLEDIDVLTYLPLHSGKKVTAVLEISERPLLPTMKALGVVASYESDKRRYLKLPKGEKFPVDGGLKGGSWTKVKCAELWTDTDVKYFIDGQLVDKVAHNYGFIPYVEIPGYTTSSRDPAKATVSAIDGQRELVKEMRRVLTIWLNWAFLAGFPFLEAGEDDNGTGIPDDANNVTQLKAGSILRKGTRFVEAPQAGRDLGALAQIFQAEADRAGLASVMYGSASGISSGYMGSDLRAAAMSILKPIIRNGGRGIARVGQYLQRLIDTRVQDTVYVYGRGDNKGSSEWLGLGPKDIKGYYPVKATMRPLMPLDEIAQRDSAIRMKQARLWDPETALEHTGENQPERILDKVAAYEYMEKSGVNEFLGKKAAQKAKLLPPDNPPAPIYGPNGEQISQAGGMDEDRGIGGPGIGAIQPSVPGITQSLVPPAPQNPAVGGPNSPVVIRQPGRAIPAPSPIP